MKSLKMMIKNKCKMKKGNYKKCKMNKSNYKYFKNY